MCRFVESAREDEQERVLQLGQLWSSKDPVVHDTAAKLVHDSNPKLQAAALFTLLRAKDASYLLMAREEILKAASGSGNTESARNLVLAITQEFPAAESMSVLKAGALGNNTELRTTIAYAARSTRSADAIPILLPLVDDPDGEVAWNAMHSLGELAEHLDWRPTSRESAEWQRCLNLWHEYAAGKP